MRPPLTRDAIVDKAWHLLLDEGIDALSLRRVASELGVTAPALYAHIDGKADLVGAVANREYRLLLEKYSQNVQPDPVDRTIAHIHTYFDYVLERPNAAAVLWNFRSRDLGDQSETPEHDGATEIAAFLSEPVREAIEGGLFRPLEPWIASLALWTAVQGLAVVLASGFDFAGQRAVVAETLIDTLIRGLRA